MTLITRRILAQTFVGLGLLVMVVAWVLMRQEREPFSTWFFDFVWWSYIFVLDGCLYIACGESLFLSHPFRFLFLAVWSAVLWSVFEILNARLENWAYVHLPSDTKARWSGYFVSYATVLPGIFETYDGLERATRRWRSRAALLWERASVSVHFPEMKRATLIGMGMLVLPLVWPRYFFPLVWGAFVFLWNLSINQEDVPLCFRIGLSGRTREHFSFWRPVLCVVSYGNFGTSGREPSGFTISLSSVVEECSKCRVWVIWVFCLLPLNVFR